MNKSDNTKRKSPQWTPVGLVLGAGLMAAPALTLANEYSFQYEVEAGYETNDNVRLTSEDEIDISGGVVNIPATLTSRSERMEASLGAEMSFTRYDEDGYDSDDQDLNGRVKYLLERGDVTGYAGYKRDSTRTSEFLDTGFVGFDAVRRETASVGGSTSYLFTQNNGISAGIDYLDVDYDSDVYQDYKFASGYAGWLHQLNERTRLRAEGIANWFENEGLAEVESDGVGARVGFDSQLSENVDATLLVGWITVDTEYSGALPTFPEDDESDALLLQGSIKYERERYQLEARVRSEPRPSAGGTVVENHTLNLSYRYRWLERSRLDLGMVVGQRSALDDRLSNERDFARFNVRVDYRFSPSWYMAATYAYSYQDRERSPDSADSNEFFVSLIFQPEKSVWSR